VQIVRLKYVRKRVPEARILIAQPLSLSIERGLAGPGFLAWVQVSRSVSSAIIFRCIDSKAKRAWKLQS
jgi:hypothetical protein